MFYCFNLWSFCKKKYLPDVMVSDGGGWKQCNLGLYKEDGNFLEIENGISRHKYKWNCRALWFLLLQSTLSYFATIEHHKIAWRFSHSSSPSLSFVFAYIWWNRNTQWHKEKGIYKMAL